MRIRIFSLVLGVCMLALSAGLAYVQVFRHEKYRVMSEENRLKVVPLMAPRGSISDRNGKPLVKDILSFEISVIYSRIKNKEALTEFLSSSLTIPEEEILSLLAEAGKEPYVTSCLAQNVGMEKAIQIEELSGEYPGLFVEVSAKREYLKGRSAASVLGYIGYINRYEFDKLRTYGYKINDRMGRDGVEKYYDDYLRGRHGGKQVEVDHRGREVNMLGFREPLPGKDLRLTIDIDLQMYCDKLLEGKKGVIIVMDPNTGEVIAMASAPGYDPNVFIERSGEKSVRELLNSRDYPLLNRAVSGVYPMGSVFKAVTAIAALETGTIVPGTEFSCSGQLTLGKAVFNCWRKNGHGTVSLLEAIKGSCNVYFFRTGLLLGGEKIAVFSKKLGLGEKTGIDLPGEKEGTVPSAAWKSRKLNQKWYKGDTVNYSIGQGYLLCSPLQVVRMMSVFANGGQLVSPFLVKDIGGVRVNAQRSVDLGFSRENLNAVKEGLRKVVNDVHGTGMKAKIEGITVAGKTGTAQTSRKSSHGWFSGFAPAEDPKLAIVVFDEYGGRGGYYAAETAGKVFQRAAELGLL
ncbi:MAG: penicillin-binding protein 2 [Candidatus Omnitrophota bacterium]